MSSLIGRASGLFKGKGLANLLRRAGLIVVPLLSSQGDRSGVRLQWKADGSEVLRGSIIEAMIAGRLVRFFVSNDLDEVQGEHRAGRFYEPDELAIIGRYFRGGTFVDVGANVGNHSLHALLFLDAKKVIAFEPLPAAARLLEINVALNNLQDRFELHKVGLSDTSGFAAPDSDPRKIDNLGATRLTPSSSDSDLKLARGDDVLEESVDFIKIDTEGFELRVLEGLRRTIATQRPTLFVEVEDAKRRDFDAMMSEMRYRIAEQFRRYPETVNVLAVPEAIPSEENTGAGRPT